MFSVLTDSKLNCVCNESFVYPQKYFAENLKPKINNLSLNRIPPIQYHTVNIHIAVNLLVDALVWLMKIIINKKAFVLSFVGIENCVQ